jgi:hypothetical protein
MDVNPKEGSTMSGFTDVGAIITCSPLVELDNGAANLEEVENNLQHCDSMEEVAEQLQCSSSWISTTDKPTNSLSGSSSKEFSLLTCSGQNFSRYATQPSKGVQSQSLHSKVIALC